VQRLVHTLTVLGIDGRSVGPTAPVRDLLDAAGVAVSIGLLGLVLEGATGPARILLVLAFAFFAPGRAMVTNWPRFAYWSEFGMSIVLSVAVLALLATVALWAHMWHPVALFEIEAPLTTTALVIGMVMRHLRQPGTPAEDGLDGEAAILDMELLDFGSRGQPDGQQDQGGYLITGREVRQNLGEGAPRSALQMLLDVPSPRTTVPPEGLDE
jgi:hypothetical protein